MILLCSLWHGNVTYARIVHEDKKDTGSCKQCKTQSRNEKYCGDKYVRSCLTVRWSIRRGGGGTDYVFIWSGEKNRWQPDM